MEKCFADKDSYCSALNKKKCEGCNFFRTEEDVQASRCIAKKRIESLDDTTQDYIYGKYFKGEK